MLTLVRLFLMVLALIFTSYAPAQGHDVHATMTEVLWNERDSSLEIVMEMHAELLEARLSIDLGQKLSFLNDGDFEILQTATEPLVGEHLQVSSPNGPIPLTYLGLEYRDEHLYIYLETSLEAAPQQLEIMNSLFLDDLPGQINSVVARVGGVEVAGKIAASSDPLLFHFHQ